MTLLTCVVALLQVSLLLWKIPSKFDVDKFSGHSNGIGDRNVYAFFC
jgi:hypothetical protein